MLKKRWKLTLRQKIYMFVIVAGFINILMPCVVHADIYGADVPDIYEEITENVRETNELITKAYKLSAVSPYTVFGESTVGIGNTVHTASQTVALVVATLLLMVDFFRKTVNFEWSSKWENVLLFLIKIIVLKQVVQNSDTILSYIYTLFNYINTKIVRLNDTDMQFLPWSKTTRKYSYWTYDSLLAGALLPWWKVIKFTVGSTSGTDIHHSYMINEDAVRMFYPYATFPDVPNNSIKFMEEFLWKAPGNGTGDVKLSFNPTIERIFLFPYFLIMKMIAYFIFVIVIGRLFELCIYTILAPLPLSTFASETANDIAKNFIKNYIAVVLQMTVIAVMFACCVMVTSYLSTENFDNGVKYMRLIVLLALALGVAKSGEWSKKICGA